ncbi:hypothetical protein Tco_1298456, partial [Tanacetum coccineum]
ISMSVHIQILMVMTASIQKEVIDVHVEKVILEMVGKMEQAALQNLEISHSL